MDRFRNIHESYFEKKNLTIVKRIIFFSVLLAILLLF